MIKKGNKYFDYALEPGAGLGEYIQLIETINHENNNYYNYSESSLWYRGQQNSEWGLTPGIQRVLERNPTKLDEKSIREYERGYATKFQIKVSQLLKDCPSFEDYPAWITLMRHYGVHTRLLDWSISPLVALYFAVSESKHNNIDACVWVLNPRALNESEKIEQSLHPNRSVNAYVYSMKHDTIYAMLYDGFKSWQLPECPEGRTPEDIKFNYRYNAVKDKIAACYPLTNNSRVYNQQSAFTVHNTLRKIDEIYERYDVDGNLNKKLLYKIYIPASCKSTLCEQLELCCFTTSSIYPDLEYVSKEINAKYKDIIYD